jgi:hypothetical protein
MMSTIWVAPRQETYLAETYSQTRRAGNAAHQNVLVTWTEAKTLHKQQHYHILVQGNPQILKPIWNYGIQLQCMASTSNIEVLEHFQSKVLRMFVDTFWYVPSTVIRRDLQSPTVIEEIRHYSSQYNARLSVHPDNIVVKLMVQPDNRRLRRSMQNDLLTRF